MPFPIAHPAAVLPLRRHSSRWLSFPALVVGSLVPDVAYLSPQESWSDLSHHLPASLLFGLPVGILMIAAFYGFRTRAVEMLPAPFKQLFLPLCQRPKGSVAAVLFSLVFGIATHLFLDSFTHKDGWLVLHVAVLQLPVLAFGDQTARVCHVLWYGCSFVGVAMLFVAFERWKEVSTSGRNVLTSAALREALLLAGLVLPIALIHHLIHSRLAQVLTAAFCLAIVAALLLRSTRRSPAARRPSGAEAQSVGRQDARRTAATPRLSSTRPAAPAPASMTKGTPSSGASPNPPSRRNSQFVWPGE
jgi:hypothetical protein